MFRRVLDRWPGRSVCEGGCGERDQRDRLADGVAGANAAIRLRNRSRHLTSVASSYFSLNFLTRSLAFSSVRTSTSFTRHLSLIFSISRIRYPMSFPSGLALASLTASVTTMPLPFLLL